MQPCSCSWQNGHILPCFNRPLHHALCIFASLLSRHAMMARVGLKLEASLFPPLMPSCCFVERLFRRSLYPYKQERHPNLQNSVTPEVPTSVILKSAVWLHYISAVPTVSKGVAYCIILVILLYYYIDVIAQREGATDIFEFPTLYSYI